MNNISHEKKAIKENNFVFTDLKSYIKFDRPWADISTQFLTRFFGSLSFLNINVIIILVWIIINLGWIPDVQPFDPYPFPLLLMISAFSAMLLAIVVLINQNEQGKMADVRQRIDLEINVRAENEITKILIMLDELHTKLGISKSTTDKELEEMKEKIDIAEVKEDIESGIKKEDADQNKRLHKHK